jgi:hypothetical protein
MATTSVTVRRVEEPEAKGVSGEEQPAVACSNLGKAGEERAAAWE